MADGKNDDGAENLIHFPFSRLSLGKCEAPKILGETEMTRRLGGDLTGAHGHWCSRCNGIWFSTLGEVECPGCGNRHG